MVCRKFEGQMRLVAVFRRRTWSIRFASKVKKEMKISGAQVKAARELLKITQPELAEACGVAQRTLRRFETDEGLVDASNLDKILAELERRGIEFTNGTGIGVRLNFEKAAAFARGIAKPRNESDR